MEQNTTFRNQDKVWYFEKSFSCPEKYDQFINWLSFEFYMLQQEQERLLTIYFPNGTLQVEKEEVVREGLVSKLQIASKCQKTGMRFKEKLLAFLAYFDRYDKLNDISVLS